MAGSKTGPPYEDRTRIFSHPPFESSPRTRGPSVFVRTSIPLAITSDVRRIDLFAASVSKECAQ